MGAFWGFSSVCGSICRIFCWCLVKTALYRRISPFLPLYVWFVPTPRSKSEVHLYLICLSSHISKCRYTFASANIAWQLNLNSPIEVSETFTSEFLKWLVLAVLHPERRLSTRLYHSVWSKCWCFIYQPMTARFEQPQLYSPCMRPCISTSKLVYSIIILLCLLLLANGEYALAEPCNGPHCSLTCISQLLSSHLSNHNSIAWKLQLHDDRSSQNCANIFIMSQTAIVITTHPPETNRGVVTSYLPVPSWSSVSGCSAEIYSDVLFVALNPFYGQDILKTITCLPQAATLWWQQSGSQTTTELGPLTCPDLYTTASTSVVNAYTTFVACCPR